MDPTLAESWQRLVARIVDGLVVSLITSPVWIPFLIWYFRQLPELFPADAQTPLDLNVLMRAELKLFGISLLLGLAQVLIMFFYDWFQHAKWGQTIGKRVLKIKVVVLPDRAPMTGGPAAKRAAAYALVPAIPGVGGILNLINVLWQLWDRPNRQCLHDKFAHTVVIKTKIGTMR